MAEKEVRDETREEKVTEGLAAAGVILACRRRSGRSEADGGAGREPMKGLSLGGGFTMWTVRPSA